MTNAEREDFEERLRRLEEEVFDGDIPDAVRLLEMHRIAPPESLEAVRAHKAAFARVLKAKKTDIVPSARPFKTIHDLHEVKTPLESFKQDLSEGRLNVCSTLSGEMKWISANPIPIGAVNDDKYRILKAVAESRTLPAIALNRLKSGRNSSWANLACEVNRYVARRVSSSDPVKVESAILKFHDGEQPEKKVTA